VEFNLKVLDQFILLLLSFTVLIDMINGFFLINSIPIPLGQIFKFFLLALMILRLLPGKDMVFVLLALGVFQIAPVYGFLKTGNFSNFIKDFIIGIKWFNFPLSFFYFKAVFQSPWIKKILPFFKIMIGSAIALIIFNQFLGVLGFGQAFYYEGYANASGTKGFIYAGNELTILVLALAFLISNYYKQHEKHFRNLIIFSVFLLISFTITSKTVLAGVVIVFLIPYLSFIKVSIKKVWFKRLILFFIAGIPLMLIAFYFGITKSGFLDTLQYSVKVNQDLLTVLLSNRNNFVIKGWEYFLNDLSLIDQFFGMGEAFYLDQVEDIAEIDFLTLLFSKGVLGLGFLLFIIYYWLVNAKFLAQKNNFVFAKAVFVFIIFLCIAGNTAGHIFNSGIAAFYTAMGIALMFFKIKPQREIPEKISP